MHFPGRTTGGQKQPKIIENQPKSLKFTYCILWLTHDPFNGCEMLYIVGTHIPAYYLIDFGVSGVFQRKNWPKQPKIIENQPKSLKFSYCILWLTRDPFNGGEMLYIVENHILADYLISFGVSGVFQREKLAKNSLKLSKISHNH